MISAQTWAAPCQTPSLLENSLNHIQLAGLDVLPELKFSGFLNKMVIN